MSIPQNEPGTDVVDNEKAAQTAPEESPESDLPLTEADDGNTRTPDESGQQGG
ncbi:hypothetical protein [Caballeronia sp. Lep1P3]|uniref:hypothetical protein n=1 Tax=Caballeronia sp. Lep1P3 TaxID=2878150 RepID=UPI001FD2DBFC|nr:hypothetical protein [Caballeronia sp. Lep1P3]